MGRTYLVIFAGMTIGLGPAAIDSYVAALGVIKDSLNLTVYEAQLSLSVTIFGMGFGQIFCGPLSDRFGRVKPLYIGFSLYLAGCVICLMANSIEVLLIGRALQGISAAAGQIVARAILRDLYDGIELAHRMSEITAVMSLIVLISPWMGLWFTELLGWHGDFVFLTMYGLFVFWLMHWRIRETNGLRDPNSIKLKTLLNSAISILRNPQSLSFMLVLIIGTIAMMAYVVNAPIVYAESFGITGSTFAAFYSVVGIGVFIGQLLNRYLIRRIGTMTAVLLVMGLALIALTTALLFSIFDLLSGYGYGAAMILYCSFFMMALSNSTSLVMDPHGHIAGFAASLLGTLSLSTGTLSAMLLSSFVDGQAIRGLLCMVIPVLISFLIAAAWLWMSRLRRLESST